MIPLIWIRRGAALIVVACGILCVTASAKAISAWTEVSATQAELEQLRSTAKPVRPAWSPPPALPLAGGANIEEALPRQLSAAIGLNPTLAVRSIRPLGGGPKLVELAFELPGDARTAETLAQWVTINREVARMPELRVVAQADGASKISGVLWVTVR